MNEDARKQVVEQLNELRTQVKERLGADPERHDPVAAHVEQVRTLVETPGAPASAHHEASGLERRLLAWEAEHPQLVTLASRIARVLEDAGL